MVNETSALADARLLRAMSDPTRLAIVRQLATEGWTCQCDLTVCCDLAQPTVSHHMRVLREAGLVTVERRGTWAYYQLAPAGLLRFRAIVAGLLPLDQEPVSGRRLPVLAGLDVVHPAPAGGRAPGALGA